MKEQLLIIGFVWPEPKSSAAGSRMMQLIRFFQTQNFHITFASACGKSDNAFDLSSIGVTAVSIELNDSSFDEFIVHLKPDIVLFDRFMTEEQFGWRVAEFCEEAVRILDTEDLHFLRRAREQAVKTNSEMTTENLFNDTAKREIASIYRCDLSLIISKAEMTLLDQTFKIDSSLLLYIPFLLEDVSEAQKETQPVFKDRQHFVSIGNFLHEPNYNALLYLKESLWKGIKRQLPKAELHNYGAYASEKVNQLHNEKDGFLIKGFAQDVHEVMQCARVLLAPVRFGAGLKGKLFDAMQNGTPFITTSIGAEGVVENRNSDFICDSPETFISQAVALYSKQSKWEAQHVLGFDILASQFSKSIFETDFLIRLNDITKDLKRHRQQNFIGGVLQHHTLQSTKFMSKWIEAKNALS